MGRCLPVLQALTLALCVSSDKTGFGIGRTVVTSCMPLNKQKLHSFALCIFAINCGFPLY